MRLFAVNIARARRHGQLIEMRRRARWVSSASIVSALFLTGCAYMNPYVDAYPTTAPPRDMPGLPDTSNALTTIDKWGQSIEGKHKEMSQWHRGLNIATFGLATGAVIAPIYNAYKDLTSALALGAGASYMGNTLFFPPDQISLYGAALTSLGCVQQRGEALGAAMPEGSAAKFEQDFWTLVGDRASRCASDPDYVKLKETFDAALVGVRRVEGSDASAAGKLRHAGQNVVIALNEEIDKRAPSPQAVLAAAKSLVPFSAGLAGVPIGARAVPQDKTRDLTPPPCIPDDKAFLASQVPYYSQRQKGAESAIDGINNLDTACVFNAPAVADLSVDQEKITIIQDASVNINVRGGRPPYDASFAVEPTPGVVLSQPLPDRFRVSGVTGIKDGEYKLIIRDSSASGRTKMVPVTAKAKS